MVNDIQTVIPVHAARIHKEIYEWSYYIKDENSILNKEDKGILVKKGITKGIKLSTTYLNDIFKIPKLKKTVSIYHGDIHTIPLREGDVVKLPSGEEFIIKNVVVNVDGEYTYTVEQSEVEEPTHVELIIDNLKEQQRTLIQSKLDKLNWLGKLFNDYHIEDWRVREYDR